VISAASTPESICFTSVTTAAFAAFGVVAMLTLFPRDCYEKRECSLRLETNPSSAATRFNGGRALEAFTSSGYLLTSRMLVNQMSMASNSHWW
jgi:hypothetical protein